VSQVCHTSGTVVLQWCRNGAKMVILTGRLWCYSDVTLVLQWCQYFSSVALVLQWCYSEDMVVSGGCGCNNSAISNAYRVAYLLLACGVTVKIVVQCYSSITLVLQQRYTCVTLVLLWLQSIVMTLL
jgi:hypothetical protein